MMNKIIGGTIAVITWNILVVVLYFLKISLYHLGFLVYIAALLGMYFYPRLISKVENKEEKNSKYYWRLPIKTLVDLIIVVILGYLFSYLTWGLIGFIFPNLPSISKIISSSYGI